MSTKPALDWSKLGFEYVTTRSMLRYNHRDGAWDSGALQTDFNLNIHALSNVLHYGQAAVQTSTPNPNPDPSNNPNPPRALQRAALPAGGSADR